MSEHENMGSTPPGVPDHKSIQQSETAKFSSTELLTKRHVVYFSDGIMEVSSNDDSDADVGNPEECINLQTNLNDLTLGPLLRYKAIKIGSNILAGIDYIGGGIAAFLGISTPKYSSQSTYFTHDEANAEQIYDNGRTDNNNKDPNGSIVLF